MDEHEYTGFAAVCGPVRDWRRYEITLTAFYYDSQGRAAGSDAVTTRTPDPEQPAATGSNSSPALRLKLREAPRIDLRLYVIPRELPCEKEPDGDSGRITVRINKQHVDLLEESHPVDRWNGVELRYEIRGEHIGTNHLTGAV